MITLYLSLLIISLLISLYAIHTAITEEEYLLNASKKQTKVYYGRHHPKVSDPGLLKEVYSHESLQNLVLG